MKTVGQILLTQRKNKGSTLEDVYSTIKIQPKYIKALESGDYDMFDNKVQVKGFLKIYAEYLDLDLDQVMAFWRREYEAVYEKNSFTPNQISSYANLEDPKFIVTARTVFISVISLLLIGFFSYLFYQYKTYTGAPELEVFSPTDNYLTDSEILDITGKTERDSVVYINNQRLNLNSDGTFATSLKLSDGLNTLSISSTNRLGKSAEITKTVIYRSDQEPIITTGGDVVGESTASGSEPSLNLEVIEGILDESGVNETGGQDELNTEFDGESEDSYINN